MMVQRGIYAATVAVARTFLLDDATAEVTHVT